MVVSRRLNWLILFLDFGIISVKNTEEGFVCYKYGRRSMLKIKNTEEGVCYTGGLKNIKKTI